MLYFSFIFADMYDIMDLLIDDTHCMGYNTIFLASLMFVLRAAPNMTSDGPTASGCGMWNVTTVPPYTVRALAGDPACEPILPLISGRIKKCYVLWKVQLSHDQVSCSRTSPSVRIVHFITYLQNDLECQV